jgi:plastocyanin
VIVVVGGLFFLLRGSSQVKACTPETARKVASPSAEKPEEIVVTFSNDKFSPSCLVVKSGAKIKWTNESAKEIQIGADPHPIHTGNKEVSGGSFVLKLSPSESAEVRLTKKGKFGYHDHLHASSSGVIIVE